MLDPAGNIHDQGRIIDSTSERTAMLQCAQALKQELETNKNIKVIFGRFPGEYTHQDAKAQLANQLHVDLCIRLQAYQDNQPKVQLYIFTYDDYRPHSTYTLQDIVPYNDAYMINKIQSQTYASTCAQLLADHQRFLTVKCVQAIPVASLRGIRQPALCIEMGLKHATDWRFVIGPLASTIQKAMS
jgi:N-acetylmuramoyl-L-alanine amidase